MINHKFPVFLPSLLLGLALGSAATWTLRHTTAAHPAPDPPPPILNHQSSIKNKSRAASASNPLATRHSLPATPFPPALAAEAGLRDLAFDAWTARDASTAALAWADTAFEPAFAWATSLPDPKLGGDLSRQLLAQLASTDPTRAVALARAVGDEFFKASQLTIFRAWAEKDPATAVQTLGTGILENETKLPFAPSLTETLGKWYLRDPQPALDWIHAASATYDYPRNRLFIYVCFQLARAPATASTAATLLLAHPEQPDQRSALGYLARRWVDEDPRSALAWLDSLSKNERNRFVYSILDDREPRVTEGFLAVARRLPEVASHDPVFERFALWLRTDPDEALAWIATHDYPEFAPAIKAAIARSQDTLLARVAGTDPAAAVAEWQNLPDSLNKTAAAGPLALAWARIDPAAAARWLIGEIPSFSHTDRISSSMNDPKSCCRSIAALLVTSDPESLMKLAETVTDPELRQILYAPLYDERLKSETTLSHSERADLLSRIPDEETRAPLLTTQLTSWLRQDFHSARAWIDRHDIVPPALAAQLITKTDPSTLEAASP